VTPARQWRIVVIYDGACPLCSRYAVFQSLSSAFERVDLVDARTMTEQYWVLLDQMDLDINSGIVVVTEAVENARTAYSGAEALRLLATFEKRVGLLSIAHRTFRVPWVVRFLYPALFRGRRLLLRILRIDLRISR